MKPFALSVIAAIIVAVGAALLLNHFQEFAYQAYSTSGTRVSDPGTNLVGPTWSGDPSGGRS
jgi:hypothetical protein